MTDDTPTSKVPPAEPTIAAPVKDSYPSMATLAPTVIPVPPTMTMSKTMTSKIPSPSLSLIPPVMHQAIEALSSFPLTS